MQSVSISGFQSFSAVSKSCNRSGGPDSGLVMSIEAQVFHSIFLNVKQQNSAAKCTFSHLICFLGLPAAYQLCWPERCQETAVQSGSVQTCSSRGSSDQWNLFFYDCRRSKVGKLGPGDSPSWIHMKIQKANIISVRTESTSSGVSLITEAKWLYLVVVSWCSNKHWVGVILIAGLHPIQYFSSIMFLCLGFCLYDYHVTTYNWNSLTCLDLCPGRVWKIADFKMVCLKAKNFQPVNFNGNFLTLLCHQKVNNKNMIKR